MSDVKKNAVCHFFWADSLAVGVSEFWEENKSSNTDCMFSGVISKGVFWAEFCAKTPSVTVQNARIKKNFSWGILLVGINLV